MNQIKLPQFKFCPFCGDSGIKFNEDQSRYMCPNCHNIHYINSKPSVCAVIFREDENSIYLVTDSSENNSLWDFPGGFLHYGEKPEDGLRREIREELGVEAEIVNLRAAKIDTYSSGSDLSLNLFYDTNLKSEPTTLGEEIKDARRFGLDKLPNLKYQSTKDIILSLKNDNPVYQ